MMILYQQGPHRSTILIKNEGKKIAKCVFDKRKPQKRNYSINGFLILAK